MFSGFQIFLSISLLLFQLYTSLFIVTQAQSWCLQRVYPGFCFACKFTNLRTLLALCGSFSKFRVHPADGYKEKVLTFDT